jgi:hypothetical protein
MADEPLPLADPELLMEAARVFNAAGGPYAALAPTVNGLALSRLASGTPRNAAVRHAIVGDAAALRLSGRVPGGYQAALELLKDIPGSGPAEAEKDRRRLFLLRALARGQEYKALHLPPDSPEAAARRGAVLQDLAAAGANWVRTARHFWEPRPRSPGDAAPEDDLLAVRDADPTAFDATLARLDSKEPPPGGGTQTGQA